VHHKVITSPVHGFITATKFYLKSQLSNLGKFLFKISYNFYENIIQYSIAQFMGPQLFSWSLKLTHSYVKCLDSWTMVLPSCLLTDMINRTQPFDHYILDLPYQDRPHTVAMPVIPLSDNSHLMHFSKYTRAICTIFQSLITGCYWRHISS